jgi:hypothetical protein
MKLTTARMLTDALANATSIAVENHIYPERKVLTAVDHGITIAPAKI